jgi:hypothetical protein
MGMAVLWQLRVDNGQWTIGNETGIRLIVMNQVELIRQIGLIRPITLFPESRPSSLPAVNCSLSTVNCLVHC